MTKKEKKIIINETRTAFETLINTEEIYGPDHEYSVMVRNQWGALDILCDKLNIKY